MIHTQRRWCKHPSNLYILQEEPYLLIPEIPNAHLIHIRRDATLQMNFILSEFLFFLYIYSTLIYKNFPISQPYHKAKRNRRGRTKIIIHRKFSLGNFIEPTDRLQISGEKNPSKFRGWFVRIYRWLAMLVKVSRRLWVVISFLPRMLFEALINILSTGVKLKMHWIQNYSRS